MVIHVILRVSNLTLKAWVHSTSTSFSIVSNFIFVDTWHIRVGHPSHKHLSALKDVLHFVPPKTDYVSPCKICHLAKQPSLQFHSHNNMVSYSFDLLHCDVWGPYQARTHVGFCYFLTLVDDSSHYTWIFL